MFTQSNPLMQIRGNRTSAAAFVQDRRVREALGNAGNFMSRLTSNVKAFLAMLVALFVGLISIFPQAAAQASDLNLDIDMGAFFDAINQFVPVGFEIYAIPIGILVAFLLVRFVGNALVRAFKGGEL